MGDQAKEPPRLNVYDTSGRQQNKESLVPHTALPITHLNVPRCLYTPLDVTPKNNKGNK